MPTKLPEKRENEGTATPKLYHVGTLTYTKASLAAVLVWLLWGDLCFTLMETVVPTILPVKFEDLGAPNWMVGMVLATVPQIINLFANPFISFKSDRYRSPQGRRIPFITRSMVVLVLLLLGLGYADAAGAFFTHHNADHISVIMIGIMMVLFSVANMFVNSVFWYLFNDVIPEQFLAQFMAWFRMVSSGASSLYMLLIFPLAGNYSHEIFIGASMLYLFGFAVMCLNVKEGKYPPPPQYVDGKRGLLPAIKTYWIECYSTPHYLYIFLVAVGMGGVTASAGFALYLGEATGLNLQQYGTVGAVGLATTTIMIGFTGWLADRFHPIRVAMAGLFLQVFVATPLTLLWLFWHPSPQTSYHLWLIITVAAMAPASALWTMLDPPVFMRIFPRDRYGQFCSANAIVRAVAIAIGGITLGLLLDLLKRHFGERTARCCLPIWQLASYGIMLMGILLLYRSWNRHGGDVNYVPPIRTVQPRQLPIESLPA